MTEKKEYKEIFFHFTNKELVFSYDEETWKNIMHCLITHQVIDFKNHVFTVVNLQFVERR